MPLLKTVTPQLLGSSSSAPRLFQSRWGSPKPPEGGGFRRRRRFCRGGLRWRGACAAPRVDAGPGDPRGTGRSLDIYILWDQDMGGRWWLQDGHGWTMVAAGWTWVDDGGHGYRHPQQAYDHANSQHFVWGDWASDRVYIITKKLNNKKHSNMIICV